MKVGIFFLGLILQVAVDAQWPENSPLDQRYGGRTGIAVHGQIYSEGLFAGLWTVELRARAQSIAQSTSLAADGSFEFHSVVPGPYELLVSGPGGGVSHQEHVIITGSQQLQFLSISMRSQGRADRSAEATVSIRQLKHKSPPQARKEYNKGRSAARKGDYQMALDHFRKAVSIDPEFADAYNDLGAAQVSLGKLEQAAEHFQKTVDLVPDHTLAVANLSIVLCRLKRYAEAGQAARQALRLDPAQLKLRYILALTLSMEPGHEAEALDNLERAAAEIPKARRLAADILIQSGRRSDAVRQLEQYLRTLPEQDTDRKPVQELLAQLQRQ
jgi:tetratricopeptide (TPR) repeat protein